MNTSKILAYFACLLIIFFSIQGVTAQENTEEEDNYVTNVFNYGLLINTQTTETVSKGSFEFRIQHRFGEMDVTDFKNTVLEEFLGFDGSANIRFGLVGSWPNVAAAASSRAPWRASSNESGRVSARS